MAQDVVVESQVADAIRELGGRIAPDTPLNFVLADAIANLAEKQREGQRDVANAIANGLYAIADAIRSNHDNAE